MLEEIAYRGFFVFYLSQLIPGVFVAVLTGWLLCVLVHLYQGNSRILPVTVFYAFATCLIFSPIGLFGAIGFHIYCNLGFVLQLREFAERHLLRLKAECRQRNAVANNLSGQLRTAFGLLVVAALIECLPFEIHHTTFLS